MVADTTHATATTRLSLASPCDLMFLTKHVAAATVLPVAPPCDLMLLTKHARTLLMPPTTRGHHAPLHRLPVYFWITEGLARITHIDESWTMGQETES